MNNLDDVSKPEAAAPAAAAAAPASKNEPTTAKQAEALLRRAADVKDMALLELAYAKISQFKGNVSAPDEGPEPEDPKKQKKDDDKKDDDDKDKKEEEKDGEGEDVKKGVDPEAAKEALQKRKKIELITGDSALHRAAEADWVEGIHKLVMFGADVEAANRLGSTPLHRACSTGSMEAVKALVEKASNVRAPNKIGNTPLHCAVYAGYKDIVKYLLLHGANLDVDTQNKVHMTPWDYANHIVARNFMRVHLYKLTNARVAPELLEQLKHEEAHSSEHDHHQEHKDPHH